MASAPCNFQLSRHCLTSQPLLSLPGGQFARNSRRFVVYAREFKAYEEAVRIQRPPPPAPLRPGKVSPPLPVPAKIPRPPYVGSSELPELSRQFQIHDSEGIERMRAACRLAAHVLEYAGTLKSVNWKPCLLFPSVTTDEIDRAVHKMIIDAGAYPSPLGYSGFPKSVCTSVNECMCHGIPDSRPLEGYHGDTSKTFLCGDVDNRVKRLMKVYPFTSVSVLSSEKNLNFTVLHEKQFEPALPKGLILQSKFLSPSLHCAVSLRKCITFGVVERFVGHGVGTIFHSEPIIYHHSTSLDYRNLLTGGSDARGRTVEGLTFTIEPILTMGSIECDTWDDNWTALTTDGSPAAQFEHTVLITRTGAEILTKL
ncbi:Methionine aminopeptidase 1B, chloroplastic-like protein [Drosera capensis]